MPWCCGGKDDVQEPQSSSNRSNSEVIQVVRHTNIEYSITVKTGDDRNAGTDGPVFIKIFGRDDKQTDEILLKASSTNEKPFQSDCTKKFTIIAIDIGKPQRIIIRHEDKIHGWLVDYVEISVNKFLVRFVANRWLNESKNDRKLSVELFGSEQPAVLYKIQIETGDQQIEPLDSPVYVQVFGTTTTTPKLFLSSKTTSFAKNSADDFTISSNNVGEIQRIIIGHEALGTINDWHLKSVKLQMLAQQKQYTVDKWLSSTKDDKQLFVELTQETPPPPPPPPSTYSVSVQTGNVQNAGTMENIELIVRGTQGQIAKIPLKNHTTSNEKPLFQQGNMDQFQIIHADIGNIESITIGFSDSGQKFAWLLEHVNIKYQDTVYHFQARCWLSSRLGSDYSWMTIKPHPSDDALQEKKEKKKKPQFDSPPQKEN